jgi:hypothetical protein
LGRGIPFGVVDNLSKNDCVFALFFFLLLKTERFKAVLEMLNRIGDNIHLVVKHVRGSNSRYYFMSNH